MKKYKVGLTMYVKGELLRRLTPLDEDEIVYKELYNVKQNEKEYKKFLEENKDFEHNALLRVTESTDFSFCLKEDCYLFDNLQSNICISRHKRYSPMRGHSHTFFEMIYVLNGSCQNIIEGTPITLTTGDICIMSSDVTHALSVFDESLVVNILIKKSTFKETFFRLLRNDNVLSDFFMRILYMDNASNYILFHTLGDERLHTLLEFLLWDGIYEEAGNSELREYLLLASFSYLLENHVDNITLSDSSDKTSAKIVPVLQYIKKNYKDLTLSSLANEFNYVPNYLSNLIKDYTGYTFIEILTETRLSNACKMLRETNLPINEIAHLIGYNNIEHFYRVFKRCFNETPNKYRQILKGDGKNE